MSFFHLTEEDHDADETEDSSEDQAPNTQPVVVCREKTMTKAPGNSKTLDLTTAFKRIRFERSDYQR